MRHSVNEVETDDELLMLDDGPIEVHEELLVFRHDAADRWYTRLKVNTKTVRFLLDTGATRNLIPGTAKRHTSINVECKLETWSTSTKYTVLN